MNWKHQAIAYALEDYINSNWVAFQAEDQEREGHEITEEEWESFATRLKEIQ